jgi:hypothetical protein
MDEDSSTRASGGGGGLHAAVPHLHPPQAQCPAAHERELMICCSGPRDKTKAKTHEDTTFKITPWLDDLGEPTTLHQHLIALRQKKADAEDLVQQAVTANKSQDIEKLKHKAATAEKKLMEAEQGMSRRHKCPHPQCNLRYWCCVHCPDWKLGNYKCKNGRDQGSSHLNHYNTPCHKFFGFIAEVLSGQHDTANVDDLKATELKRKQVLEKTCAVGTDREKQQSRQKDIDKKDAEFHEYVNSLTANGFMVPVGVNVCV